MLTGELSEVLRGILDDYDEHKIHELISTSAHFLSTRVNLEDISYRKMARELRSRAEKIKSSHSLKYRSADIVSLLQNSSYAAALPVNIARIIAASLPDDPSRAASSSEIKNYGEMARLAVLDFGRFVAVSENLSQFAASVPGGGAKIRLLIPNERFDEDLEILGNKLEKFDRFFSAVAELEHPQAEKPKILSISEGSLCVDLIAYSGVAVSVMKACSKILHCALQLINVIKAARTLRDTGIDAPEIDIEKVTESVVEKVFTDHFAQASVNLDPEQASRIRIKIKTSAVFLIEEVQAGTRVSLDIESEREMLQLSDETTAFEQEDFIKSLEEYRSLQLQLDRRRSEVDPMPRLAGPDKAAPAAITAT